MSELGARASGQGRIFQTSGDQYIEEHHHHYDAGTGGPLFGRQVVPPAPAAPDSVRMPLVGRTPGVLRDREELRRVLGAAVAGPGGEVHVVHGMGGCGKTALAHWLFTEAVREHGRVGFWVNASERMSLRAGMLAVAGDRGAAAGELAAAAAGQRAASDLVWHYLDQSPEPWLLVLDNADDPTVLEDGAWLRAGGRGTVLVTTRHATSALWNVPGVRRHALGVLPLDDAAQILCDLAPDAGDLEAARKVAERLGRLPLALTLAGSHLAHQLLESWSMDEYDRKLDEESTAIVDRGASGYGGSQARHLVGRTWQLSLDALAGQGLPEATTLLRLLSFLAADPVPLSMLAPVARGELVLDGLEPALSAGQLEPALRGLLDHSLAALVASEGERCVQAHGVLLDSVRTGVSAGQRSTFAEGAAALLEGALPEPGVDSPDARGRLTLLTPHASALLAAAPGERTGTLAVRVVRQVFDSGDYAGALGLAPGIADRIESLLGVQHPVALEARDVEARALFRMGRYPESEALHRRVLGRRELVLGPDHPDTLRSCFGLHQPLDLLDKDEEAEGLLRRALEGQRRILGADSPETLLTWALLPEVLAQLGKEGEFDAEVRALTAACERSLSPDHFTAVGARHSIACGLWMLGRFQEAEPLAREVLADRIRLQGRDHPLALSVMYLTVLIARDLGRTGEAVETLKEVLERRERVLGREHPFVTPDRERLAAWQAEVQL
ncbi:tetratricopeptide repeat protein [Streptomyces resistomycificus]|uniref:ATP/GTP-binding protein n=1 Tax=Streptomyces resistomycificus TaxID=67356 RepID=A0A0L8L2R3_9ACTN|nr:tetratricopeptide repeat protein [Streptomyces resistomycificus]KOG32405.1 ATP/GTP-binding protein [Streptomyces resistomycificus]KUN91092.1 ATP/GTP-binding protein [Streptomyces resistomycificus]